MPSGGRVVGAGDAPRWSPPCLLTSCGNGPTAAQKKAIRDILTTTTTTTTTTPTHDLHLVVDHTTQPGVVVPNVIGLKIAASRAALRAAGFPTVSLNTPCNKGTLASQSVVASLAIPGTASGRARRCRAPERRCGRPAGHADRHQLVRLLRRRLRGSRRRRAALPCGAPGHPWGGAHVGLLLRRPGGGHDDDRAPRTTSTSTHRPTTTKAPETTTTVKVVQTVLTQSPAAHTVLHPGATVTLTMHHCPQ